VYGPRQNPHGEAGVVAIFAKRLLAGQQPIINGDGEQSRDFVYVGDVVSANEKALSYEQSLIVNIGTGVATTVNTIFDTLCTLTKSSASRQYGPAKPGEQRASLLDATKAGHLLGWKATITLSDGLSQTAKFFTHEG
jgi:UDP-glucose 4-epimerase